MTTKQPENVYNLTSSSDLITVRQDKPYHHQLPPYGNQGSPFVIAKHRLLYPTRRKFNIFYYSALTFYVLYIFYLFF